MGSSDQTQLHSSSPCPRSSLSLPVLPLSWLLSLPSLSQGTTSWRSLAALWTRSSSVLGKLKLHGTTVGTLLISRAVLLGLLELLTVDFASAMSSAGWDSWSASYSII